MRETVSYSEMQFVKDVREAFASTKEVPQRAVRVAELLRRMLAVPGWPESSIPGSAKEPTVYARITSQDLGQVWRHRYNPDRHTGQAFMSADRPSS